MIPTKKKNKTKIKLYNSISRRKVQFYPINDRQITFYSCGPTVYDWVTIGNWRSFLFYDLIRRSIEYFGFPVNQIMNITDVEDKIINKILEEKKSLKEVTQEYTQDFLKGLELLNILKPTKLVKATNQIDDIVKAVKILLKKGYAYQSKGSVYFNLAKFSPYGQLSQLDKREIKVGARVSSDEYSKENPADFVLWKAWTPKDGEVFWDTALGKGRPGWHIECSVMALKYLGQTIDLHAGGVDLLFPHHENEIAQSEALTGQKFVNYWLHGGHILVNGQKMSKSMGNIYHLDDLIQKGFDPLSLRMLVLQTHYRDQLNFTWESLQAAQKAYEGLVGVVQRLENYDDQFAKNKIDQAKKLFSQSLADDFNWPQALAAVFELINGVNQKGRGGKRLKQVLFDFDRVLGLELEEKAKFKKIPPSVTQLAKKRQEERQAGNWKQADQLRNQIEGLGFRIEDKDGDFNLFPLTKSH
jgi:cysteinyl-tRNA synthetase